MWALIVFYSLAGTANNSGVVVDGFKTREGCLAAANQLHEATRSKYIFTACVEKK